jgi:hypothetical protein
MLKPRHLASELNIPEYRVRHHLRILYPDRKPYTRWEWSESGVEKELHNIREYRNNRTASRDEKNQGRKQDCKVIAWGDEIVAWINSKTHSSRA